MDGEKLRWEGKGDSDRLRKIVGEKEGNSGLDKEQGMDVKRKGGQESGSGGVDSCQE